MPNSPLCISLNVLFSLIKLIQIWYKGNDCCSTDHITPNYTPRNNSCYYIQLYKSVTKSDTLLPIFHTTRSIHSSKSLPLRNLSRNTSSSSSSFRHQQLLSPLIQLRQYLQLTAHCNFEAIYPPSLRPHKFREQVSIWCTQNENPKLLCWTFDPLLSMQLNVTIFQRFIQRNVAPISNKFVCSFRHPVLEQKFR